MIDYSRSYVSRWRVYRVNERTWLNGEPLDGFVNGSISVTRDASGDAPRIESGSMEVRGELPRGYYRIVMESDQDGTTATDNIATLLFETSDGDERRGVLWATAQGQSVLYPAYTERIATGEYAPAGVDGAQYAARMLRRCVKAPVVVDGGFTLNSQIVHEFGARILEAVWQVLAAGGFVIQIHGDGGIHILPMPTTPALVLDDTGAELLTPGTKYGNSTASMPNRYRAEDELETAVVVNDDPGSSVSTVARGYIYDELDTSPCPVDGETLERYAARRLEELSTLEETREYSREWARDVYPFSVVKASADTIGVDGNLRVLSQSIECGHGAYVTEQAYREVRLWQA